MSTKLFVGSLSYEVDKNELEEVFKEYGTVVSAQVIMDRETNRSRGFGFVEMSSADEAKAAIEGLNGSSVHGRTIVVNLAKDSEGPRGGSRGPRDGHHRDRDNFRGRR